MSFAERLKGYGRHRVHFLNEDLLRVIASNVISPGDSVFDMGANVGYHTKLFSELVGGDGRVHAFEPNPDLWKHFVDYHNVRLWPVGVGDRISVERFILPIGGDQVGSLVDPRSFLGQVDVMILNIPQVTIDSLEEATQKPVKFIKIDVERREYAALQGARKLIERDSPVIVYENTDREVSEFLSSFGYETFRFIGGEIPDQLCNTLAIKRGGPFAAADVLPTDSQIALSFDEAERLLPDDVVS